MDYKDIFTGGDPDMREQDFLRGQFALQNALHASLSGLMGYNKIISGCDATIEGDGSITLTAGWILLDGEVMEVEAQNVADTLTSGLWRFEKQTSYDAGGDRTFIDGLFRQTWRNVRGVAVSVASLGSSDLDCENGPRQILHKVLELGTWNMVSTGAKAVSLPAEITVYTQIVAVNALIRNDTNPGYDTFVSGGVITVGTSSITLTRDSGGIFNASEYSATANSRGKVFVQFTQ